MDNTRIGEPFHRWNPDLRRIHELPKAERPREKLLSKGADALTDVELLAVLLGSGSRHSSVFDLAARIATTLSEDPSHISADRLRDIPGVGDAKACQIEAALEFARRHLTKGKHVIRCAEDAIPYLQTIRHTKQEHFLCISLNGAHEVIESRVVSVGLLDANQVHPREVFSDPIGDRAASVIVAHNHPSGTLQASPEDLALTRRIVKAGELLGIRVLDHVIVTSTNYLSLREAGQL